MNGYRVGDSDEALMVDAFTRQKKTVTIPLAFYKNPNSTSNLSIWPLDDILVTDTL